MSGLEIFGMATVFGTLGVAVVCFILYAILHRKRHYRCPNCGERFKAGAATTFVAARDGVDKRLVCPNCGYFGYMEDHRDSELTEADEAAPQPADDSAAAQADDPRSPEDHD